MFKSSLTKEDEQKIMSVVISSLSKGICLLSIEEQNVKAVICNDNKTEDDVNRLAREFKVQLMVLSGSVIGLMPDFKLKYKSVNGAEYRRIQHEVVEKYMYLLQ